MGIIAGILSAVSGNLIGQIGKVIDDLTLSGEEKLKLKMQLQELLQKRDSEIEQTIRKELETRERIMVAELQQGDKFTKRARPSIIYFGLFVIFYNYCLVPTIQTIWHTVVAPFTLPPEFWLAWGGVVGVYAIGRSAEKRGAISRVVQAITGNKDVKSKLNEL